MKRALCVLSALALLAGAAGAQMATLTFTSTAGGSNPNSVKCDRKSITVDLSGVAKDAAVARAVDGYDGDSIGQANAHLYWETDDARIIDEPTRWGLTLALVSKAPKDECTVDITCRRCQKFTAQPGDKFKWTNTQAGALADGAKPQQIQTGEATADANGLVTLTGVKVSKAKNRIVIEKQ